VTSEILKWSSFCIGIEVKIILAGIYCIAIIKCHNNLLVISINSDVNYFTSKLFECLIGCTIIILISKWAIEDNYWKISVLGNLYGNVFCYLKAGKKVMKNINYTFLGRLNLWNYPLSHQYNQLLFNWIGQLLYSKPQHLHCYLN